MGSAAMTTSCCDHGRPVKICLISSLGYGLYSPDSGIPFGGAEVQFYLLANALAGDDAYSVSVLTTVDESPGIETRGKLKIFKRLGQRRIDSKPQRGFLNRLQQVWGYLSAFREMRRKFIEIDADMYLHAGAGVEVGAYALICRLLRRRFLFFIASSADLWEPYGKVEGPLKWLFPLGIRLAHQVVCRSREQQERLMGQYGRTGVLIRTGHPIPMDNGSARSVILWVGRIHPLKQPHLFLDLAERCPKDRFVMIGMRDEREIELWGNTCERASQLPNVSFHQNLSLQQVDRMFASAKIFVNTSTYEGFPNTFVQAALNGVPIVSWNVNPDQVVTQHQIGLYAGGSFDQMLAAVQSLSGDEPLRAGHARRARSYAIANHNLDHSVDQLKQILQSLGALGRTERTRTFVS